jgi:glycosyltransferase involved in cell wall biosynthesis
MKILIVNTYDIQGGAARAAYRLHNSLLESGVNSKMLVQSKNSDNSTIIGPATKTQKAVVKIRSILDSLPLKLYEKRSETRFSISWVPSSNIINLINQINPDIVHLHWINDGMIRIEDLPKIKAPIVWSLHDMYPFTGGCHYSDDCIGFKNKCGNCKVLRSKKSNDLSRKVWKRKKKVFDNISNLTVIGLSKWMESQAKESSLFFNKNVINLPNGIDINVFKPHSKDLSRDLWNLPKDKKLILFGAMDSTSDPRKGYKELLDALSNLNINNLEFIVFGNSNPSESENFGSKTHYLGNLKDDISLVTLYNSVDVMIVPSLQENLSNVIMESLSCGTPVVGFDIGGNSDMIEHKKNGYLAKPLDSSDLARGIEWVLNCENYDNLLNYSRKKNLNEFDDSLVSEKYIELYKNILNTNK